MPRNVTVKFEDGTTHVYQGVPDDATPDQVEARATQEFGKRITALDGGRNAPPPQEQPGLYTRAMQMAERGQPLQTGAIEGGLQLGSSMVAAPAAGLAGIAGALLPGEAGQGARWTEAVQQALTYQPRTESGQRTTAAVNAPFEWLSRQADRAGGAVAEATDSPLAGAAVNTGIQMLPAAAFHVAGRARPAPRGANPRIEPTISEPEAAARTYVADRTALDWNALSGSVRERLTQIAKDADTLQRLDPAAVERQARLESLPVPIRATRGQLTRDTAQLTNEGNLASTEAGRPLKAIRDAQSDAIVQNLEVLKGKVGGANSAQSPQQVGLSVQDAALRAKLRLHEQKVRDLYKKAESSGELQGTVSAKPIVDVLENSPDLTHLGWVDSWLNKVKARTVETTDGITVESLRNLSLKELEDLRQGAVARAMNSGTEGYYAGKVIRAIDESTEGAGGTAYKAARAARRQQALEFEDQAAVRRLVENKSRTDRATALEDTWSQTVLGGSIDDLAAVKRSLLTGGDAKTRAAGRQAWRDVRAQTIQYLIDESTKGSAPLPNGNPPVSAAGMQKAINKIGPEKMDSLFGPGTSRMIDRILRATKDVRTEPPRIHPGSSTVGNLLAFLERQLDRVPPFIGDAVVGTAKMVRHIGEMGKAGRQTREATRTPLDEGATMSRNALAGQRQRNALSNAAPAFVTGRQQP